MMYPFFTSPWGEQIGQCHHNPDRFGYFGSRSFCDFAFQDEEESSSLDIDGTRELEGEAAVADTNGGLS